MTGTHSLTRAPSHTGPHWCTARQRQRKREPGKDPGAVPFREPIGEKQYWTGIEAGPQQVQQETYDREDMRPGAEGGGTRDHTPG